MKRYIMIFLLAVVALLLVAMPLAMAEAVDAVPSAPISVLERAEFFDVAILGTFAGAAAAAEVLVLLVKWMFKLTGDGVRYTVVASSILCVAAGRFLGGDPITFSNIVLALLNGGVVAATLMKVYEVTVGRVTTNAGKIE